MIAYCFADPNCSETNLKRRESHKETHEELKMHQYEANKSFENLAKVSGQSQFHIDCDAPNTNLDKFTGTLYTDLGHGTKKHQLTSKNVLLRGCTLRNTQQAIAVVVYTGRDTKVMMNTGAARLKRTQIDYQMNSLVLVIFTSLLVFSAIAAIMNSVWVDETGEAFAKSYNWYKLYDGSGAIKGLYNERFTNRHTIAGLQFLSYMIVMNTLIPISLYVSVELVRLGQSLLITYDPHMVVKGDKSKGEDDIGARARTTTLNEELGQIDYVFSDKTGTLTQNVMTFRQCTIKGKTYGLAPGPVEQQVRTAAEQAWPDWLRQKGDAPHYVDRELAMALANRDPHVRDFFTVLAVCHTVRPQHHPVTESEPESKMTYQAESPDEKALVDAARELGFKFMNNVGGKVHIIVDEDTGASYDLLHVIEFDSTRKRMSVVVRDQNGRLQLFSKGADSIMFGRLSQSMRSEMQDMAGALATYAQSGLRTLVMCKRALSEDMFKKWNERLVEANATPVNRDANIAALNDELETELELVGASAIEDKLQDRVPETISKLKEAGMKVWVLTGDKLETAENIGASAKLLVPEEMQPYFRITGVPDSDPEATPTKELVEEQLDACREQWDLRRDRELEPFDAHQRKFALVITGPALAFPMPASEKEMAENPALNNPQQIAEKQKLERKFLDLAKVCRAVLCCRVSPLQKAKVVKSVKENEQAITLAIGDGANDVSMIKEAHIGVGISGLEGRQAVNNSDFSMGQFRFLARLLLVHGRWSYFRMSKFLRYYFYKNFVFTVAQFWYSFYNGASAMTDYDPLFISFFNVIFTFLGILVVGIFEQDVSPRMAMHFPMLYMAGPRNEYFSFRAFFVDLARGTLHSLILFFGVVLMLARGGDVGSDGLSQGSLYTLAVILGFTCIMIVNCQLAIEIKHWTWLHACGVGLGPVGWFILFGMVYNWEDWAGIQFNSAFYGAFVSACT